MSMMCLFVLFFFPRGVLDEILNLIESVSEGFPSYFGILPYCYNLKHNKFKCEIGTCFSYIVAYIVPLRCILITELRQQQAFPI